MQKINKNYTHETFRMTFICFRIIRLNVVCSFEAYFHLPRNFTLTALDWYLCFHVWCLIIVLYGCIMQGQTFWSCIFIPFPSTLFECHIWKDVNTLDWKVLTKKLWRCSANISFAVPSIDQMTLKKFIPRLLMQSMVHTEWKALYAIIITKDFPKIRKMIYINAKMYKMADNFSGDINLACIFQCYISSISQRMKVCAIYHISNDLRCLPLSNKRSW